LQWYAICTHVCICNGRCVCVCCENSGLTETTSNYCSTAIIGGETENLLWTQKPPTRFVIETSQLITLAVYCGFVSSLIGRRAINIPEIIFGVHGLMGFTVKSALFSLQVFILSTWCQENMAAYYKALVKKCVLIAIFPGKHYQFKWKKIEEQFWNKAIYICIFCLFLLYFHVID